MCHGSVIGNLDLWASLLDRPVVGTVSAQRMHGMIIKLEAFDVKIFPNLSRRFVTLR